MKKYLIVLLLLCLCLLCACSCEQTITGEVIAVSTKGNSEFDRFIIRTDDNKEIGILINDETYVRSRIDEVSAEDFKSGNVVDVMISADRRRSVSSLTTEEGKEIKAYRPKEICITALQTSDTLKLSDGTAIDVWKKSGDTVYQLKDGTELLCVSDTSGPNNVYVGNVESFDQLSETAKENILAYYADQGLLYNVQDELEKVYAGYRNREEGTAFSAYLLGQEICPTASNEYVMCFMASVRLPLEVIGHCYEVRLGAVFDRKSGEHISGWELFSCSEEEAKRAILDTAGITDSILRTEIEAAFKPENIILFPNNMEITFSQGTLPSQENSFILALDYNDALCNILHEWAIPGETNSEIN